MVEVFLFDFEAPIYGRRIGRRFTHKLRDEEHYADLDTLKQQIARDVAAARDFFHSCHALTR
jgi:riboflavin kinase/FMN adenylyltransferase